MALKKYRIVILNRAKEEVDEASFYYESIQKGLGKRFYKEFKTYALTLNSFPFFEEKYNVVRILPFKKFPYTIHFTIDEDQKTVFIQAITCDYQNPDITQIKF